ncbi:putative N-acetyltransferase C9.02c [Grifola frondosa]|uniref:Putative N-acetyltransferase C9.02c n=1 Tax=Grifola frondosa TaxID=5627 RepID=A0A1C7MLI1_GRIFR|nr:putative N-acetyltransferase C9.02c [Grifola frondosa]
MSIFYDVVSANELQNAFEIEIQGIAVYSQSPPSCKHISGYPDDEAASLEAFRYRQSQVPDLFLGAFLPRDAGRTLIAYVCATLSPAPTLTHESMSTHIPASSSVCIHSVCVSPALRRKRVGLNLVKEYLARVEAAARGGAGYDRVLLIAHEELRGFYEAAGFEWVGKSAVVHGVRPWYEMRKVFNLASPTEVQPPTQGVPAGLWEALQRSNARLKPTPRLLSTFPGGVQDIVSDLGGEGAGSLTNRFDLLCPRVGCASTILKSGVARWVERASVQLEPPGHPVSSPLAALPTPPATMQWWLVTPNARSLKISGSRAQFIAQTDVVVHTELGSKRLKMLLCAECDLGPLGWCEEGGSEFWLACNRVGYRE